MLLALSARATCGLLAAAACTRPLARTRSLVCGASPLPPHLIEMVEEIERGDAQLFDVREPPEAAAGKLKLSKLVPLSELQQGYPPRDGDPSLTTYLHCAAGIRVHPAASALSQMGYERVVPLQEGFATLYQLGFDAE